MCYSAEASCFLGKTLRIKDELPIAVTNFCALLLL